LLNEPRIAVVFQTVISGLIKASIPSRISFRVSSKVDSLTVINELGAERLLGRGDMLFVAPGLSRPVRVHGAYVDEFEIGRISSHGRSQGSPVYQSIDELMGFDDPDTIDELFEEAVRTCVAMKRASTSVLQRQLRIGYGRAAAILDTMESEGLIGQRMVPDHVLYLAKPSRWLLSGMPPALYARYTEAS